MKSALHRRGVAFIVVLWVLVLLTVMLSGFVVIARTEMLQARHLFDGTTARYAAEAGLSRVVREMLNPDMVARWVPDGRAYEFDFEGAKVKVEIQDESGKIDINQADETVLVPMFQQLGIDAIEAQKLSDAIIDWRDVDDLVRPMGAEDNDYESAGLPYGSADVPFTTVGELQQVLGMTYEIYEKLEPEITIYGGAGRPSPAYATEFGLMLYPNMNLQLAQQLVQQRRQLNANDGAGASLSLPDGTSILAGSGGGTYTVRSEARLKNGAKTTLEATIRLGGAPGARAYSILKWREGSAR